MKTQILSLSSHYYFKIKHFFYRKLYPITILSLGIIFGLLTFFFIFSNVKIENIIFILKKLTFINILVILTISIIPIIIDSYSICYISSKNSCDVRFKLSFLVRIGKIYLKILFPPFGNLVSDILKCYIFKSENNSSFTNILIPIYAYRIVILASEIIYSFSAFYFSLFIIYFQNVILIYPFYINLLPIFTLILFFSISFFLIRIYRLKMITSIINSLEKKTFSKLFKKIIHQRLQFKTFKIKLREFFLQTKFPIFKILILRTITWIFEAIEMLIIILALGISIYFPVIVIIQIIKRIIRSIFFFVPNKIGVREITYAFLFEIFNIPQAIELSIIVSLVERGRDLIYFLISFFISLYLTNKYPLINKIKELKLAKN